VSLTEYKICQTERLFQGGFLMNGYTVFFKGKIKDEYIEKVSEIAEKIHRSTFFSCEEVVKGIHAIINFTKPYDIVEKFQFEDYLKIFHNACSLNVDVETFLIFISKSTLNREFPKYKFGIDFATGQDITVINKIENIEEVKKIKNKRRKK